MRSSLLTLCTLALGLGVVLAGCGGKQKADAKAAPMPEWVAKAAFYSVTADAAATTKMCAVGVANAPDPAAAKTAAEQKAQAEVAKYVQTELIMIKQTTAAATVPDAIALDAAALGALPVTESHSADGETYALACYDLSAARQTFEPDQAKGSLRLAGYTPEQVKGLVEALLAGAKAKAK